MIGVKATKGAINKALSLKPKTVEASQKFPARRLEVGR
jgi:hypothetical protein